MAMSGITVLLLHADGENNSVNIIDAAQIGGVGHTIAAMGDAKITAADSKFGGSCLSLGGDGYLRVGTAGHLLDMSNIPFTIGFFTNCTDQTVNYPTILGTLGGWSAGSFCVRFDNAGLAQKFSIHWNGHGDPYISSADTYSFNTWRYVEIDRTPTVMYLFVDGDLAATGSLASTDTLNLAMGGEMRVGWSPWDGVNGYHKGLLDEIIIVKGEALHTSAFTPPVAPYSAPAPVTARVVRPKRLNPWFGGDGQIAMPIDELSVYGAYRCDLYSAESRQLLASRMSGTDGALIWTGLDRSKKYFGVAHDPEQILRPGISDRFITPEKMP